jgi:hypothetical protein
LVSASWADRPLYRGHVLRRGVRGDRPGGRGRGRVEQLVGLQLDQAEQVVGLRLDQGEPGRGRLHGPRQ